MKLCFQNGNIPKNRTPSLFCCIFSSGASDTAQFGCYLSGGRCDVTSCFGSPGRESLSSGISTGSGE